MQGTGSGPAPGRPSRSPATTPCAAGSRPCSTESLKRKAPSAPSRTSTGTTSGPASTSTSFPANRSSAPTTSTSRVPAGPASPAPWSTSTSPARPTTTSATHEPRYAASTPTRTWDTSSRTAPPPRACATASTPRPCASFPPVSSRSRATVSSRKPSKGHGSKTLRGATDLARPSSERSKATSVSLGWLLETGGRRPPCGSNRRRGPCTDS